MDELIAFFAARLDDDERYWRVVAECGQRRANAMTGKDMADMAGLLLDLMSDRQFREEAARWTDSGVMPPASADRGGRRHRRRPQTAGHVRGPARLRPASRHP